MKFLKCSYSYILKASSKKPTNETPFIPPEPNIKFVFLSFLNYYLNKNFISLNINELK